MSFHSFWNTYNAMVGRAMEAIATFPHAQAVLDEQANVPDMGEDQGIPPMEYERVAELGRDDIPALIAIEVDENEEEEEDLMEIEFTTEERGHGARCERTVIEEEDLPEVELTDSEDEVMDQVY